MSKKNKGKIASSTAVIAAAATYTFFGIQGHMQEREDGWPIGGWPSTIVTQECHDGELDNFTAMSNGGYKVSSIQGVLGVGHVITSTGNFISSYVSPDTAAEQECTPIIDGKDLEVIGIVTGGTLLKGMCRIEGDDGKVLITTEASQTEPSVTGYLHVTDHFLETAKTIAVPNCITPPTQ